MKKIQLLLLIIVLSSPSLIAQTKEDIYARYWGKVYRFELDDLPKSAAAVVDTVYQMAEKENNGPQLIKALLYQSKFLLTLEEDAQLKIVRNVEKEISHHSPPVKNLLESTLASVYWQYYIQNRYQIYSRTRTKEKSDPMDFRTWDLATLFAEIHSHYQNSLEQESLLQKTDLQNFNAILLTIEGSKKFRPTLYDFLAHNALLFYKSNENSLTRPSYKFEIDDPKYFTSFRDMDLQTKDSLSLPFHALKIYQNLLLFHAADKDPTALVTADIERLEFVRENAFFHEKESLYLNELQILKEQHQNHPVSASVSFLIASLFNNQANSNRADYRFKKSEALQICEEVMQHFPESRGAENCEALKREILHSSFSLRAEKYIPEGVPSRLLLEYQNMDSLRFTVHKISIKEELTFQELTSDSARRAYITTLPLAEEWQSALRNENDFLQHSTEILVPELPQGQFLMLALPATAMLMEEGIYGYATFQVTDLALVENSSRGIPSWQLIDRNSGRPVEGAQVRMENIDRHRNYKSFDQRFVTDATGQFFVNIDTDYRNLRATATYKNDTAVFGNYYVFNKSTAGENQKENLTVTPFIFTDRSIYRPGQKVYFKGILIKKQGEKSEVVAGELTEVMLEDVNGQEIQSLELKTNEYGSFNGEFTLPLNGLTGEYTIIADEGLSEDSKLYDELMDDFHYAEHTISVEEYKRPKFEAQFNPVSQTFRLNDTISISGTALSFAGSNITDAKVVYRVQRKVQYPRWFYGHGSYPYQDSGTMEITHGETSTKADGTFDIRFKAIPDPSVSKEGLPVFHYEVTADVTDLNGETRSATTVVKAGYHSMLINVQAPEKIDKSQGEQKFIIRTENLNGEFVPAKGNLKIYKLPAPENVMRKRPWEAPDYQSFSEKEFRELFSHDPYGNEDPLEQKSGILVWQTTYDTEQAKEILVKPGENWEQGKYLAELESKDAFGRQVTEKHYFTLFSSRNPEPADNILFTIQTDKAFYAPGEKIQLQLGSAAKDIVVSIFIQNKNHRIVKTMVVPLQDEIKKLEIPVSMDMTGGFAIHYSFAFSNSFESGLINIPVPLPQDNIIIESLTFRDKLQPGENQTWSFKIKGANKEKVTAELLAGMYDASLDQFRDHSWNFSPLYKRPFYAYPISNGHRSFGNTSFNIRNIIHYRYHYHFPRHEYDQFDWSGFSMSGSRYIKDQYLHRIASRRLSSKVKSKTDVTLQKGYFFGRITDDETGQGLPGVNVLVIGTSRGTISDLEGNYSIKADPGDEFVFSFVGYETYRTRTGKQNVIDVSLVADMAALEEVVVVGYGSGSESKRSVTGAIEIYEVADEEELGADLDLAMAGKVPGVAISGAPGEGQGIRVRGVSSLKNNPHALYVVDGIVTDQFDLDREEIISVEILEGAAAISLYGQRAANGAVIISTKEGQKALDAAMAQLKVRKNLQETAFFYPHLSTDKNGVVSFSFTAPEALTRWKLLLLAHTKTLSTTTKTLQTLTQQELMVMPNPPRFLREGDEVVFSAKITSLSDGPLSGNVALQLSDALSGDPVDEIFGNGVKNQSFTVAAKGNTQVSWKLKIPEGIPAVEYKVLAKAGGFSDGEQNVLPVLPNRMLVSETLPLWARSGQSKTFRLDKLMSQQSPTLQHHALTLEITSNPAWYALQALPYLMEFPYECSEQTFARYYANAIAGQLINSSPKLKEVFDRWSSSGTLLSSLEKNEELKSVLIQETPWLREAQSESEQKKRLGLLFDLKKLENEQKATLLKLQDMQMTSGGFPWFKGSSYPNKQISLHIAGGLGKLQKIVPEAGVNTAPVLKKLLQYLDEEMVRDYQNLLEKAATVKENNKPDAGEKKKDYMTQNHLSHLQLQYLYMSSFFPEREISAELRASMDYYIGQTVLYRKEQPLFFRGMIALIHHRNGNKTIPQEILRSLMENSITSEEMGMYWLENKPGWFWFQSPVETQALLTEAFTEIGAPALSAEENRKLTDELKVWLLKHKQTKQWPSTKATTEAVYALLMEGSDWLSVTELADVSVGTQPVNLSATESVNPEAGTGYFNTSWKGQEVLPEMGEVKIAAKGNEMVWGGMYWQYFEDLDKITSAETPLQLSKKLYLKKNTDTGEEITEITEGTALSLGDLVRVRVEVKVDREMDFVHMKDMRASGLEPVNVLSQYKWQDGLGYYESTKDASTNFFFDILPKGVYVFEYDLRVNNKGSFSNGITTIQSMYAPEFSSHSKGVRVNIAE